MRPLFGGSACRETSGLFGHAVDADTRAVGGFSVVGSFFDICHRYKTPFEFPVWPTFGPQGLLPFFGSYVARQKALIVSVLGKGLEPSRHCCQGILSP